MKRQMRLITKYIFLILSVVLLIITTLNYLDYLKVLEQIEKDNLLIDVLFGGWTVLISFIVIVLYELIVKNKNLKLLIRIFMLLLFLGIILKNKIPIDDFDAAIENTSVFSGFIALILFVVHGLRKLFDKKHKLPAANSRS